MVRALNRAQRRRMRSTVTVEQKTGETFDDATGDVVTEWAQVYSGRALVRSAGTVGQDAEQAAADYTAHRIRVVLPDLTVPPTGPGEVVRVTVDASEVDAELVGREFYVDDFTVQDRRDWRVLICEEAR